MRIHIGSLPPIDNPQNPQPGWLPVHGPSSRLAYWGAAFTGFALFLLLFAGIITASSLGPSNGPLPPEADFTTNWAAILLTLLLSVLIHELLHLTFYPDHGLSDASLLVIWPRRLHIGAYYEGSMTRQRWLVMRLAPFVILSVLPALFLTATPSLVLSFTLETCLSILLLVNSLGSGGDVLAAAWVAIHLPRGAVLHFQGGRAYWQGNHI
jgi:hypothetical protein